MSQKIKVTDKDLRNGYLAHLEAGYCHGQILATLNEIAEIVNDFPSSSTDVDAEKRKLEVFQLLHSIQRQLHFAVEVNHGD